MTIFHLLASFLLAAAAYAMRVSSAWILSEVATTAETPQIPEPMASSDPVSS
jgi:hypothetical protein